jgi:3-methylcrotonyl-CoA carboxylase alpha subunit
MIKRLLIANRGEIARRIIRACQELGIETVAVYSEADASAPHVVEADRAVPIGPPPARQSYLAIEKLVDAARHAEADAVHPGYGFLSENAGFAASCVKAGLTFVGPPADVIARMGSKIDARRLVAAAGVPIVPGETPADQTDEGVSSAIQRIGLPALIKASAGGGGKGMRRVRDVRAIDESIQQARRESLSAFGDGTLYVERLVERPRHVEVQVFADAQGRVAHLFERDCSTQRRHQKVIEESPSPALTPELRHRMTDAAVAVARAANYLNAGTIEFLVDGDAFYFLEMNTRLQVEHPVTEALTGVDLVRAQLLVAGGAPLPWTQDQLTARGHAIEARVYAEDPEQDFLPQAGRLSVYQAPRRPGVRVDGGVVEGGEVSIYYDPMIAKVIAAAETRALAIARLAAALRDFAIDGVRTNIDFLLGVLESDVFRRGAVDTAWLERDGARVIRHRSQVTNRTSHVASSKSHVTRPGLDPWDGGAARPAQRPGTSRPRTRSAEGALLTAPMPATVLKIQVKAGDTVRSGDTVLLLEAMKMELPLRAPGDGVVAAVRCREGELVQADAVLVEFR